MSDLTDFLTARIDERLAVWRGEHPDQYLAGDTQVSILAGEMVADLEAKRRIVHAYVGWERVLEFSRNPSRQDDAERHLSSERSIIEVLAEVYDSHLDYDENWRFDPPAQPIPLVRVDAGPLDPRSWA